MTTSNPTALGFLTVIEHADQGLFGGYLLLNTAGRPLEFHCTAPIKPNRAQQILYGPTLQPFLYGEQIGHTLVAKSKFRPLVICTDQEPALVVRELIDVPVVLVLPRASQLEGQTDPGAAPAGALDDRRWRVHQAHSDSRALVHFRLGRNHLAVPAPSGHDQRLVDDRLGGLGDTFDLAEPFERIREAIDEARSGGP